MCILALTIYIFTIFSPKNLAKEPRRTPRQTLKINRSTLMAFLMLLERLEGTPPKWKGLMGRAGVWDSTELDLHPGFLVRELLWPPPTSGQNYLWLVTWRHPSGGVRPAVYTHCLFPLCSKGATGTTEAVTCDRPAMPGSEPVALVSCPVPPRQVSSPFCRGSSWPFKARSQLQACAASPSRGAFPQAVLSSRQTRVTPLLLIS